MADCLPSFHARMHKCNTRAASAHLQLLVSLSCLKSRKEQTCSSRMAVLWVALSAGHHKEAGAQIRQAIGQAVQVALQPLNSADDLKHHIMLLGIRDLL